MTKYIDMGGWVKAVADDKASNRTVSPARPTAPTHNPAIAAAASQLKTLGLPVTAENILAAAKLAEAKRPVNEHNLKLMARKQPHFQQRDLPKSAPVAISKAQREDALLKVLNDPQEMSAIVAQARAETRI